MEKIKDVWSGLNKKGKIATVAIVAIVVLIIWGPVSYTHLRAHET